MVKIHQNSFGGRVPPRPARRPSTPSSQSGSQINQFLSRKTMQYINQITREMKNCIHRINIRLATCQFIQWRQIAQRSTGSSQCNESVCNGNCLNSKKNYKQTLSIKSKTDKPPEAYNQPQLFIIIASNHKVPSVLWHCWAAGMASGLYKELSVGMTVVMFRLQLCMSRRVPTVTTTISLGSKTQTGVTSLYWLTQVVVEFWLLTKDVSNKFKVWGKVLVDLQGLTEHAKITISVSQKISACIRRLLRWCCSG